MEQLPVPLVPASWLRQQLGASGLRLLDVRWTLAGGAEREAFLRGHIPGASFLDLDLELAAEPGARGRHPLPEPEAFAAAMRRAGVSHSDSVICYDQVTGAAARAWWLLRAAGHPAVSVLDGGLDAWLEAGGELEPGHARVASGDFETQGYQGWIDADRLAQLISEGKPVVDARSAERFRGDPNPIDRRPGHIPGASSLPWTDLYAGLVKPPEAIRGRLSHQPAAAYCGSGVTACALILALESAGVSDVLLYPGSYSEWSQDPSRAVAGGEG